LLLALCLHDVVKLPQTPRLQACSTLKSAVSILLLNLQTALMLDTTDVGQLHHQCTAPLPPACCSTCRLHRICTALLLLPCGSPVPACHHLLAPRELELGTAQSLSGLNVERMEKGRTGAGNRDVKAVFESSLEYSMHLGET
jgi:hypothetical protein